MSAHVALFTLVVVPLLGSAPRPVLPTAPGQVRRALGELPGWNVERASASNAGLQLRVCPAAGACVDLRLTDPEPGCSGASAGSLCVEGAAPAAVLIRLERLPAGAIWANPDAVDEAYELPAAPLADGADEEPQGGHRDPAEGSDLAGWLLALALILGPCALGRGLGRAVTRLTKHPRIRRVAAALAACALVALALILPLALPVLSVHDALWVALIAGTVLLLRAWPERWRPMPRAARLITAGASILGFIVLELVAATLPPAGPPLPPPGQVSFLFGPSSFDGACRCLYPSDEGSHIATLVADAESLPARSRRVVHVGDSMVEGSGVPFDANFTYLLEQKRPDERHINLGVPSVAPDFYLQLLRVWAPRLKPDLVVVHLFVGNDITQMGRPYSCCGGGPLLASDLSWRCATPRLADGLGGVLARSPPPYVLRVLGHVSEAAHQLVYAWSGATRVLAGSLRTLHEGHAGLPEDWRLLRRLFTEMLAVTKTSGARLAVAIIPYRAHLEAPEPERTPTFAARGRVVAIAQELGITVLDAWSTFQSAVESKSSGVWFGDEIPGDVHFSPAGHRRYAEWLESALGD